MVEMPKPPRVAFLFLGETLLIPHLYPIVEALAAEAPELRIECWVATSVHEGLLSGWLADAGLASHVRLRRVPGYLDLPELQHGENPPLPAKPLMLARLVPHLFGAKAVVCAEQTSLWIPHLLPFLRRRFIKAAHGAGSMMARSDPRRRAAHRLLVPAEGEKARLIGVGVPAERIVIVGYVKAGFRGLAHPPRLFADDKPVVVYAPHWQRHRSSWWRWGRQIVDLLAKQNRFNVILAPHQRLVEKAPEVREALAAVARLPHVHTDLDSFAMVDGSYMGAADIYLGDTSSQVVEFLIRPRPCVFLNPQATDWRATDDHDFWSCGEVIDRLEALPDALERAEAGHSLYETRQRTFAAEALGDASPAAAFRAARAVIAALA
jgi:hypothetical protein